jgi:hypothetical protein
MTERAIDKEKGVFALGDDLQDQRLDHAGAIQHHAL